MRVALVRRGYSPTGGAEAFLLRFAGGLRAAGHEAVLVQDGSWPREAWEGDSRVLPGRSPTAFAAAVAAARPGWEGEVVFSFERLLGADCYRAGDGVHAAWLQRRAAGGPAWRSWWRRFLPKQRQLLRLERQCFDVRATAAVVVNSLMVRDEIVRHYRYPAGRIHLVRNGLPHGFPAVASGKAEARATLGLDPHAYVAAFAGSGWERKGLAEAVSGLERCGAPDACLVVAGRGRQSAYRSTSVRFLGPVHGLGLLLAAADVFVLPTIYDPFSNACLEALAAGLPVVTTNANGVAEVLTEGLTGSVIMPRDPEAVARALQWWSSPARRAAAAGACKSLAASLTIEANVARTLEVLEGVASRRHLAN